MPPNFKVKRQSSVNSIPEESPEYNTLVEIQDRLLSIYEEDNNIFDESDVKKIILSKRYLQRFAERRNGNPNKTVEMVKNTLIWRKEQKIPEISVELLPKEFYDVGACFHYGTDVDGNFVVHVRAKYVIFKEKLKSLSERLFTFTMFTVIEEAMAQGKGWTLCADMTGISLAQYNLTEILWVLKVVVNYMPDGIKSVICYNLPMFAKPFVKLVLAIIPGEWTHIIHFVGYKDLQKYIPKENIPCFYGNPKEKFVPPIPIELKSIHELDLSPYDVNKDDIIDYYENVLLKVK